MSDELKNKNKLIELLGGSVEDEDESIEAKKESREESPDEEAESGEKKSNPFSNLGSLFSKAGKNKKEKKIKLPSFSFRKKKNSDSEKNKSFFNGLMKKGNGFYEGLSGKNKKYVKIVAIVIGGLILFWTASNIMSSRKENAVPHQLSMPKVATMRHHPVATPKKSAGEKVKKLTGKTTVKSATHIKKATAERKAEKPASRVQARQVQKKPSAVQEFHGKTNLALQEFSQMVNRTQSAIVRTTQQQEKEIFDIFKLEPEQEYKLSRLIRIAQKQDQLLKYELEVLKKKIEMERMIKKVNPSTENSVLKKIRALQEIIDELRGEIKNIKARSREKHVRVAGESIHSTVNTSSIYNELKNITVVAVGNFGKNSFAIVSVGNAKIRVGVGQHVTPHIILSEVNSNGVILSAVGVKNKFFVPLSPSIGSNIQYQSVDLKNGIKSLSASQGNSYSQSISQSTPVVVATTPPPQVRYKPSLPPPAGVSYKGGVR